MYICHFFIFCITTLYTLKICQLKCYYMKNNLLYIFLLFICDSTVPICISCLILFVYLPSGSGDTMYCVHPHGNILAFTGSEDFFIVVTSGLTNLHIPVLQAGSTGQSHTPDVDVTSGFAFHAAS